jgi:hypothetical protein
LQPQVIAEYQYMNPQKAQRAFKYSPEVLK